MSGWPVSGSEASNGRRKRNRIVRDHASLPRWRLIEGTLEQEILAGHYANSPQLPADTRIAERFGVSRMTARKALASLQHRGLIRIEQGRGAFVERDVLQYRILQRVSFTKNVLANNRLPSRRLVETGEMAADDWACGHLGVAPGTPLLVVTLLSEANRRPIAISTNFLERARFDGFIDRLGPAGDVEGTMRDFGIEGMWSKSAKVIARMPTDTEARLLDQSKSRPVVVKDSVEHDASDRPVWCHITCYAADRIQFVFGAFEQDMQPWPCTG